jgi:type IV pilus assembly protein PilO
MNPFSDIKDRWTQLTSVQKVVVQTLGMVLLAAALVFWGLKPIWDKSRALREEIDGEKIKLAQIIRTQAQINKFKHELAEIDVRYKQILTMLPESREIPGLLKSISNLGQQQGLEFLLFKPEKEIPKDFVAEIPITLHLKGNYHEIGVFFDRLRRLPRIINVKQMELGTFEEKTGRIIARCQLVTFRVLQLPPPSPTPGPKVEKKK